MLKKILFLLFFGLLLPASYKAQGPPSLKSIMKFVPSDLEKAKEMANKLLYYGVQNNIDSTIAKANYALGIIFYYQD
jgi:hypothetical protein